MKYYFEDIQTVLNSQNTTKQGLNSSEARFRLEKYGKNQLEHNDKKTLIQKLLDQISDPMIIVLIAAAIVSGILGEVADTIIIMLVVVLNSILGIVQEGKAEKAIEALQKMTSPYSKVRRDGQIIQIKSEEIVPGDIVILEAGDTVPADMRIIECSNLKIEEAALTGESIAVLKTSDLIIPKDKELPLGDRINMAYMGTNVVYGRGQGVIINTGMSTEMGKITNIISNTIDEKTPLQKKLAGLSRVLSICVLGISLFIFIFGIIRNGKFTASNILEMLLISISLAVAAIPEGLVAVVTIVLSIGVTKMSKRNAIIRRLPAVETLGCTQIICSDKTGTLTQNKMTVTDMFGDSEKLAISMTLCNDAVLSKDQNDIIGEPTETALVKYALGKGINKNKIERQMPRVAELAFDSTRKMMSTVHKDKDKYVQFTKGAPDELLKKCTHILIDGSVVPLTDKLRSAVLKQNKRMADKALRVLSSAIKEYDSLPDQISPENLEQDLTFIGLIGMIDPVRPEVKPAIEKCRRAGIHPIMITGDHINTAVAIAKELNIISHKDQAIEGINLSKMSDEQLKNRISNYSVYARVQPEHKVRIVNAWKKHGKVTAMTGDGVNDAPALKSADIGIGMGITGTDVAKNVSDMVLADDNFATIVYAVEEGRRIYDNILKTIQFLLSSNLSEVFALFVATLMNFRLFTPIHILWINLITDSLPAIALGMENAEPGIMEKPPRNAQQGIFADKLGISIIYQGIIIAVLTLISFLIGNKQSHIIGMSMAFVTLSMCEIFHSLNLRSRTKSIFKLNSHNKYLFGAMSLSFVLTVLIMYIPGINTVFKLSALSATNFLKAAVIALIIIPVVEIIKVIIVHTPTASKTDMD